MQKTSVRFHNSSNSKCASRVMWLILFYNSKRKQITYNPYVQDSEIVSQKANQHSWRRAVSQPGIVHHWGPKTEEDQVTVPAPTQCLGFVFPSYHIGVWTKKCLRATTVLNPRILWDFFNTEGYRLRGNGERMIQNAATLTWIMRAHLKDIFYQSSKPIGI